MTLGIVDEITHSTVRIETTLSDGNVSCGTGFYMNFLQNKDRYVPVIVTNKHVVKDAQIGKIHITLAKNDGTPDIGNHELFQIENFEQNCIKHPDPDVDLVAFPMSYLLRQITNQGKIPFYRPLTMELIPKDNERESFSSMEDIIMIGYPNGIWDAKNNLPIIRKGITATHCGIDWNGKTEFLTDIASFPGSSGSPVFLANIGSYMDNRGNTYMGTHRIRLLGIHYAGAMHTATGEIKIVTSPNVNSPFSITQIPNNIGVAINSNRILEIEDVFRRLQSTI